ncbi:MAG: DUF1579 domain-containing protein [Deltaproteobacteria bacterium]|nr:MAG: DUF1579 domain-containing protein [Deltaproteobacteria bacterium]
MAGAVPQGREAMDRTNGLLALSLALALGLTGLAAASGAQETNQKMTPEMEAWIKAGQPGEHHRHLARLAGTWTAEVTTWMPGPEGVQEVKSTGKMESKMIFDGRYLESHYQGTFMGQQFEGFGLDAYDNVSGKYVGIWIDSMSTTMAIFRGECDGTGKVRTSYGRIKDPVTGRMKKQKAVTTIIDENTYTYEAYEYGKDGKEVKMMKIVFTRI